MKKKGYFKKNYNLFINSFKKIDIKIFFIVFFDLIFYSLAPLIVIATFNVIKQKALAVNLPQNIMELGVESAETVLVDVRGFFFLLTGMIILMLITIIIDWSIFKGLAWGSTVKRKFNFKYFLRFFLLNLTWLGLFIILVFLFALTFKESVLWIYVLLLSIIWIYFTNIIYALFTKKESISSIKKAFKLGFTKVHYFILPYIVLIIVLLIIFFIANLIAFLPYGGGFIITILMLLFYFAWARFYIVEVVGSL